jgi:hypothetical protein
MQRLQIAIRTKAKLLTASERYQFPKTSEIAVTVAICRAVPGSAGRITRLSGKCANQRQL